MTDLSRLRVSRTKHGAYKIASLLRRYPAEQVLAHVADNDIGVRIDRSRARSHLCVGRDGLIPTFWAEAQRIGTEAIDALVLVALIFSHEDLILAMKRGRGEQPYTGLLKSPPGKPPKTYSAFAHDIDMLGFSVEHSLRGHFVKYDFHRLFQIPGLNTLVLELLELKLLAARWNQRNLLIEEIVALRFHDVFAAPQDAFVNWLLSGKMDLIVIESGRSEDAAFFFGATDRPRTSRSFSFAPGRHKKRIGTTTVTLPGVVTTALLLHNDIQNQLSDRLIRTHGADNVRTEHPTGEGTSIDIVVRNRDRFWFYEIKTDDSVRGCIRQALPQLLEYAYWGGLDHRVEKLIVVGPSKITPVAEQYLELFRKTFGIRLHYEQFCLSNPDAQLSPSD